MLANKASIQEAGKWFCVDSTTIAAITSCESHAGRVLRDAWGDTGNGFGFGLMQVGQQSRAGWFSWLLDFGCKTSQEVKGLFYFIARK